MQQAAQGVSSPLRMEIAAPLQLDERELPDPGTILVESPASLSAYQVRRLAQFTENGGQLILFGELSGELATTLNMNPTSGMEELNSGYILEMTLTGRRNLGPLPIEADIGAGRLRISRRYTTEPSRGEVWLRFVDQQPLLTRTDLGDGRILWFNTDLDLAASNLVIRGFFPPLIQHLITSALPISQIGRLNHSIGDTLQLLPLAGQSQREIRIQRPDGITEYTQVDSAGRVLYTRTDEPGFYTLFQGRERVESAAVNISAVEAYPAVRIDPELPPGTEILTDGTGLTERVLGSQRAMAMWPWLLGLAVILFFAETWLARITRAWRPN
jgi:hypothetical protein